MAKINKNIIMLVTAFILIITGVILEQLNQDEIYILISYGLGFLIGGYDTFLHTIHHLKKDKAITVDFLMIVAAIGAFMLKEFREGAVLILIFALSHILEDYAILKSKKTFMSLLKIAPAVATLMKDDGTEKVVNVNELKIDDVIKVKVGDQIGADGIIIEGSTLINEKTITGEFMPKEKGLNDKVYAGTINVTSAILVKVNKDPKETVAQNIVNFVKKAQEDKTERETWIKNFEKWYVYVVILLSLIVMFVVPLTGLWTQSEAFLKGVIVLVVASPCALVASITPAILSSLSKGARLGILIKGGKPLEKAKFIDTVVFDKTGTITKGVPIVSGYEVFDISEEEFLSVVVAIEKESNHPLAIAIVDHFKDVKPLTVLTTEKAGVGLRGKINDDIYLVGRFDMKTTKEHEKQINNALKEGNTLVNVSKNGLMVGYIKLKDTIREDAYKAIKNLNLNNVNTHMLTGDNDEIAKDVKEELNISTYASELMPEEKVMELRKLKAEGKTIMMIGDGINDAPALATSDVSVAMGSATDVSLEVSDIVFINNELDSANKVIELSKRMNNIVIQNIVFSISIIIILLMSNLFGFMTISLGVVGHEGSTILVILNSLRLLRIKKEEKELIK